MIFVTIIFGIPLCSIATEKRYNKVLSTKKEQGELTHKMLQRKSSNKNMK
jgi:hypothetical protein